MRDVLVESPVVEIRNPQAKKKCRARQDLIILRQEHIHSYLVELPEAVDGSGILSKSLEAHCTGLYIFHKSKLVRSGAKFFERVYHHNRTADDQGASLDQIGPGTGFEASSGYIHHRNQANYECGRGNRYVVAHLARHRVNRQCTGISNRA